MIVAGPWLVAGIVSVGVHLAPPPPEAVRAAVDAALGRRGVQRDLPTGDLPREPEVRARSSRARADETYARRSSSSPSSAATTAGRVLLFGALGVLGVVLAVVAAQAIGRQRAGRRGVVRAPSAPVAPPAPPGLRPLDDAGALAAAGRFDAAVHLLLLHALATLHVDGQRLPAPWTSREAVEGATIAPEGREALRALIRTVEWSLFGGRPAGPDDYARALEAYRRVASAPSPEAGPIGVP